MTDAELSLAVAKVMWPHRPWRTSDMLPSQGAVYSFTSEEFDYRTNDALGKMAVWVAKRTDKMRYADDPLGCSLTVVKHLKSDDPHRALAELVLEIGVK